jgi:hypothetical protein
MTAGHTALLSSHPMLLAQQNNASDHGDNELTQALDTANPHCPSYPLVAYRLV